MSSSCYGYGSYSSHNDFESTVKNASFDEVKKLIDRIKSDKDDELRSALSECNLSKSELDKYYEAAKTASECRRAIGPCPRPPVRATRKGAYHSDWSDDQYQSCYNSIADRQKSYDDGSLKRIYEKEKAEYESNRRTFGSELENANSTMSGLEDKVRKYRSLTNTIKSQTDSKLSTCFSRLRDLKNEKRKEFEERRETTERKKAEPRSKQPLSSRCKFFNGNPGSCRNGYDCKFSHS